MTTQAQRAAEKLRESEAFMAGVLVAVLPPAMQAAVLAEIQRRRGLAEHGRPPAERSGAVSPL